MYCGFTAAVLAIFQGFSWLVIFETGRDGTVLTCLAGRKLKAGQDGTVKQRNSRCLDGTGRDGACEFSRRDGTAQYNDLFVSRRHGTLNESCHDGTGR